MIERKIKDYFSNREDVAAVYLFGSHAAGKERSESDVDIAILFQNLCGNNISDQLDRYLVDLSRLLKKDVHLIVLNHAGEAVLEQILNKGKCLIVNDKRKLAVFRVNAYAKIFDFSRYRKLMQSGLVKSVIQG